MKLNKIIVFLTIVTFIAGCKPELDSFEPSAGNANFSKYVALGNSLTAGYKDGTLTSSGQEVSYPNIIAQQLKLVGGGEFKQPMMYDDLGFGNKLVLNLNVVKDCSGQPIPGAAPTLGPTLYSNIDPTPPDPRNFQRMEELFGSNNLGVPGAKSFHLLAPNYGTLNPYFGRFSVNPVQMSVLEQAAQQNPSFFTLWIGNNDVLTYALAGGYADSITSPGMFQFVYNAIVQTLTANGAKGAVANIPDITGTAYFRTIPYNGLVLTTQEQVTQLNTAYGPLGMTFAIGPNAFVVQDPAAPYGLRQIKSTELIMLGIPQDSLKCAQWGSAKPIPAFYYLSETKIAEVKQAIESYNTIIRNIADQYGLAYVDTDAFFKAAKTGLIFDGAKFNTSYISGGINSLDGIHLTARGNAIVANLFIEAINQKYQAKIPTVNVNDYPGVIFP